MATVVLDAGDMKRTLGRLAHEILEANGGAQDLVVVGILRRGYPIAKRLAFMMTQIEGHPIPCGQIDSRPYRDDRENTDADESEIPFEIKGRKVVLVDEVIYTGRTIRAAIDAVLRFGRPKEIQLAVLVDRGHRELPIMPNYTGKLITIQEKDRVMVKVTELDGEDVVIIAEGVPA